MVDKFFQKSKKFFNGPQTSVLYAASVIMLMIVASKILGILRLRVLAHFFAPDELSLFFAAFRLPESVFEVLVFGTFSSAFIPVFTRSLGKSKKEAWKIASTIVNLGFLIFSLFSLLIIFLSSHLYGFLAPGFGGSEQEIVVRLARILFLAQGLFVISYVLTAVLESSRRFLIPAIAPLFYNLGIILSTIFLSKSMGLYAPAIGVILGAFLHFLIQLPLAFKLGFRFSLNFEINDEVKKIGRLALPRVIEVGFMQVSKWVELFLSSLISTAAYTYFTFGNTLQLLPVGLFGTAIAKAALPTLARQADEIAKFRKTLFSALYQVVFLVLPISAFLIVLRIPLVRLFFGTDIYTWEATVQTSLVLSAFAIAVVSQASASLLARAFYALHDTKTPLIVSIVSMSVNIILAFLFVKSFQLPAWGLALAFSIGSLLQASFLFCLINKKIDAGNIFVSLIPFFKSLLASFIAGGVMFLLLKVFDRSVWIKRLSFLSTIDVSNLYFEKFVLDTRYTVNLVILTFIVTVVGTVVYLVVSLLLRSSEIWYFLNLIKKIFSTKKVGEVPPKEAESVIPPPSDTAS